VANDLGWVPLAPEMNPFQAEIGGNQGLVTWGNLQDRAIVTDASYNPSPSGSPIPNARDQQFFGVRQNATIPGHSKYTRTNGLANRWGRFNGYPE
jgi:hypothetical protein